MRNYLISENDLSPQNKNNKICHKQRISQRKGKCEVVLFCDVQVRAQPCITAMCTELIV